MNNYQQQRHQYLDAMGITIWQAREKPTPTTANKDKQHNDNNQQTTTEPPALPNAVTPTTTSTVATTNWLIWLNNETTQPDQTGLLKDLQALCQHALATGSQPTAITYQQPQQLTKETAVLAIGLSPEQLDWLTAHHQRFISIAAIDTWHNQPALKQQLWQTLTEQLW